MAHYYTLDEAANALKIPPTKLKEMAKKGEIRAFQDRGNLRFRATEIDEMARAKGLGSDPELQLGESIPLSEGPVTPRAGNKGPKPSDAIEVFDFTLPTEDGSKIPLAGNTPPVEKKDSSPDSSARRKAGPRPSTLKAPPPMVSSDSDVRLVAEGSDLDFHIADEPTLAPKSPAPSPRGSDPSHARGSSKSKLQPPSKKDSVVRLEPPGKKDNDSDVKLVGEQSPGSSARLTRSSKKPSDSDIRIDQSDMPLPSPSGRKTREVITEEIDLDAEFKKAEDAAKKGKSPTGSSGRSASGKLAPKLPTSSPFELSEDDLELEKPAKTPAPSKKPAEDDDSSSEEFTLAPLPTDDSSTESAPLEAGSDEVPLMMGDDEVSLGELTGAAGGSGINLQLPADSGISLEQGGSDEIEFELSLDPSDENKALSAKSGGAKPGGKTTLGKGKPAEAEEPSEFELSLEEGSDSDSESGSDSEFELTLDGEESVEVALDKPSDSGSESDSEFELTLDEGGGLEAAEEAGGIAGEEEKDIFETDFEVPALEEEESGSEVAALESDTDVETSDFDLSSGGGDADTGSQVVDLEDEEADAGAATVRKPMRAGKAALDDEAEVEEDAEELLDEDEDDGRPVRRVSVEAAPPEWGVLPALVLIPCVLVLFVVGLMGFELIQGMWGYHRGSKFPGMIIDPIARQFDFDGSLPKTD